MASYEPVDIAGNVDCLWIDLVSFNWTNRIATFQLPEKQTLRILFPGEVIVRILDEFALSTEDKLSELHGLVPHHFAYRVSGDPFVDFQSAVWRETAGFGALLHYRFITGGGCLDVLTHAEPEWEIAPT